MQETFLTGLGLGSNLFQERDPHCGDSKRQQDCDTPSVCLSVSLEPSVHGSLFAQNQVIADWDDWGECSVPAACFEDVDNTEVYGHV